MQNGLFLLTVMGRFVFLTCQQKEYHLIEQKKTWAEAQSYCRDKYTDLATVSDMTDNERLSDIMNTQEAWIGLSSNKGQDNRKWHWSLPGVSGEVLGTMKPPFADNEPNDAGGLENCVIIYRYYQFHDVTCDRSHKFACIHETKPPDERIVLINKCLNWTQAQNYCREHHTDLFSGLDQLDLLKDKILKFNHSKCGSGNIFWIGLFRDTWSWSDGNISSFRLWDQGLLKDGVDKKECATVLKGEGKWSSANCANRKHFVCYDEETVNSELLATQQPEGDLTPTDPGQGRFVFLTCQQKEYHLIEQKKTWAEAQSYCRDKYTDLATVSDMTDNERLSDIMNKQEAWIGLSSNEGKDNRKWHWSLPGVSGEVLSTLKPHFADDEPNDHKVLENCVIISKELYDAPCDAEVEFACIHATETKPPDERIVLINKCLNWTQAQNYCREHHTDLFSGLDQLDLLKDKVQQFNENKCGDKNIFWIGLFRDTWSWSDGNNSSFRLWDQGLLKDGVDKKECATVLKGEGKWSSANCEERKHFVCYDDEVILIKEAMTWDDAVNYCRRNHHDLVSVTNPHKQRWVAARAKKSSSTHVWLGLRYTCVLDLWFWVNDHLLCYDNWGDSFDNTDTCVKAAAMKKEDGKWFKMSDNDKFDFVCALK